LLIRPAPPALPCPGLSTLYAVLIMLFMGKSAEDVSEWIDVKAFFSATWTKMTEVDFSKVELKEMPEAAKIMNLKDIVATVDGTLLKESYVGYLTHKFTNTLLDYILALREAKQAAADAAAEAAAAAAAAKAEE
jgi:hypothetical protein